MERTEDSYSKECKEILKILKKRKNVLISGPPACGKSRLLNEIANAFENEYHAPILAPTSPVLIPRESNVAAEDVFNENNFPSYHSTKRRIFRTVFHQNTKYREFVTGYAPNNDGTGFKIVEGTLYRASEFAKNDDSAALLIIDEINRGPAVQIFGGGIVGIEPEKRLGEANVPTIDTQFFEILDINTGNPIEYALPENLYIVAAMNQADTSVEPLDIAFLRRWSPYTLKPNYGVLYEILEVSQSNAVFNQNQPDGLNMLYEAAILALQKINHRISIGKSKEYQIGHGVFLTSREDFQRKNIDDAQELISEIFSYIIAHVAEIFFNDSVSIATVLNAYEDSEAFIRIEENDFGEEIIQQVTVPDLNKDIIYKILLSIIGN